MTKKTLQLEIAAKESVIFKTDEEEYASYNEQNFIVVDFIFDLTNEEHLKVTDPISFPLFEIKNESTTIHAYTDEIKPLPPYGELYCKAIQEGVKYIESRPTCSLEEMKEHVSSIKNSGSLEDDIYIKGFMVAYYKM